MRAFVYQLVERLSAPASRLSRNRHFALFASPAGQRALRLHRHLQALGRELHAHRHEAKLEVFAQEEGIEVHVRIPSLSLTHSAFLSPDDLRVLELTRGALWEALERERGES